MTTVLDLVYWGVVGLAAMIFTIIVLDLVYWGVVGLAAMIFTIIVLGASLSSAAESRRVHEMIRRSRRKRRRK